MRPRNKTALENKCWLRCEPSRVPDDKIRELAHLNASYQVAKALGDSRVDGVFAHVPPHSEVIGVRSFVLFESAALHLVLMGSVPASQNDLAAAAHSLRIGAHHANGAHVLQHVLRRNGLGTDTRLCKGNVLGDVFR